MSYLWEQACLSFIPKVHGMLAHAVDQVKLFGGIGDMLEDELEHLHQQLKKLVTELPDSITRFNKPFLTQRWRQSFRIRRSWRKH